MSPGRSGAACCPPSITTQPQSITTNQGATATFWVVVSSGSLVAYQWKFNGSDLATGTGTNYVINNAQSGNVGSYQVVAVNVAGSVTSSIATLTIRPPNDAFANRTALAGVTNTALGSNVGATKEPGEPSHAGNPGGHSVWWTWTAPTNGSVTISTIGSSFDTLLGIYTGATVSNLTLVASDDDSGGGFGTSLTSFTASPGITYQIAVDGYFGATGNIQLNLAESASAPSITTQPASQFVMTDSNAVFSVGVTGALPLSYQWLFNGTNLADNGRISGSQSNPLSISSAVAGDGGNYQVVITNSFGSVTSGAATLTVTIPYTFGTLAGTAGSSGSLDGTGSAARFDGPQGTAVDSAGNVYVADTANHTIRKITAGGVVSTLAGLAGNPGSADGTNSGARFNNPYGVAVDSAGTVYVADTDNSTIRKVTPGGVVTTLAGLAGFNGSTDGTNTGARFFDPCGVAVDGAGNLYVADTYNSTIRKITPSGIVTTLAGSAGNTGSTNGFGSAARFNNPYGVAVDGAGNVYVADTYNSTIRKITPAGAVSTLAGLAGNFGTTDGAGPAARFFFPLGVGVDTATNVYVADEDSQAIRRVTSAGVATTLAGLPGSFGSADGTGNGAQFYYPSGIAVDSAGILYVADQGNDTIRKGGLAFGPPSILLQPQSQTASTGARVSLSVTAGGSTPLNYQWSFNGTNISGGSSSYAITNVQTSNAGNYRVVVTNAAGSVTSAVAVLTILNSISLAPKGFTNAGFQVVLTGPPGAYIFEGSGDLFTWSPISTNTVVAGPVTLIDPTATSFTRRFYRTRQ
jgi:hypothetical protein